MWMKMRSEIKDRPPCEKNYLLNSIYAINNDLPSASYTEIWLGEDAVGYRLQSEFRGFCMLSLNM